MSVMDRKELREAYLSNLRYGVSQFDSLTLSIAGGALAISITFIDEIVPIKSSICIWILFMSQGFFVAQSFFLFSGR